MKKVVSVLVAGAIALSMAACSNGSSGGSSANVTIDSLRLGKDYTNLKASLVMQTHRTDIVNTKFPEFLKEFNKLYPNITVKFVADTNYATDMTTKLTTKNWGDICMIPTTLKKTQLPQLFISYGKKTTLSKMYNFLNNYTYSGTVYGIPSDGNVQGIVYNKSVFTKAGITETPKTPDEFINDLKLIKEKTSSIPLYTNFAAGWTMTAWDAYITSTATGNPDYTNKVMVHGKNPFAKPSDGSETGPYYVYKLLYDAVNQKLTESDPTTTDWESSKAKMNKGEIATMALGSWAVQQIQQAGSNAGDIAYMPFPISVNGKQYALTGADYNYGINKNSSKDNQIAAMLFVKWMVEKSNLDTSEGNLPVVKGKSLPEVLSAFKSATMLEDNPAPAGEEDLYDNINKGSELALNSDNNHAQNIVETAEKAKQGDVAPFDSIMNNWNQKWTAAQKEYVTSK